MFTLPHPLILASASPRRKEILEMVGLEFEVIPSLYEEPSHSEHLVDPALFAQEVAIGKGEEVFDRLERKSIVLSPLRSCEFNSAKASSVAAPSPGRHPKLSGF